MKFYFCWNLDEYENTTNSDLFLLIRNFQKERFGSFLNYSAICTFQKLTNEFKNYSKFGLANYVFFCRALGMVHKCLPCNRYYAQLHRIPRSPTRKKEWLRVLNIDSLKVKDNRICRLHFRQDFFTYCSNIAGIGQCSAITSILAFDNHIVIDEIIVATLI